MSQIDFHKGKKVCWFLNHFVLSHSKTKQKTQNTLKKITHSLTYENTLEQNMKTNTKEGAAL